MNKLFLFVDAHTNNFVWSDVIINKKGICLKSHEIEILRMVHLHKIISVNLLNNMYMFYRPNANKKAISNHLARLVEKKILYQRKHMSVFNNISYSYFYVVGEVGMKLLKAVNDPQFSIKQKSHEPSKVRIPNLHNYYATETIQELYLQNKKTNTLIQF